MHFRVYHNRPHLSQCQEADESTLSSILEVVKILLRTENVEVNAQDLRGGLTPLYYAAEAGNRYSLHTSKFFV